MRTNSGYLFRCKECGKMNLLLKSEPRDDIWLKCTRCGEGNPYEKSDFKPWHGAYDIPMMLISVEEN